MCVIFKFIFAYLGLKYALYLETNPLGGLVVGLVVGHMLDYSAMMRFASWRANRFYAAQAKQAIESQFLNSLFLMFGQLCAVDGAVSREEVATVDRIMIEMLKLDRRTRRKAIEIFKSARKSGTAFQSNAARYFEIYHMHPQVLESTVQLLFQIGGADGYLKPEEEKLIRTAATIFGIDEQLYEGMRRPYAALNGGTVDQLDQSYAILGCQQSNSNDEIKDAYRKLATEYHPDKIASKNLPEEFIKFATRKFQDIQNAYELVKTNRGI